MTMTNAMVVGAWFLYFCRFGIGRSRTLPRWCVLVKHFILFFVLVFFSSPLWYRLLCISAEYGNVKNKMLLPTTLRVQYTNYSLAYRSTCARLSRLHPDDPGDNNLGENRCCGWKEATWKSVAYQQLNMFSTLYAYLVSWF